MSKPEKVSRSGFVIKLSSETVQKLSVEANQANTNLGDSALILKVQEDKTEKSRNKSLLDDNQVSVEKVVDQSSVQTKNVLSTNNDEDEPGKDIKLYDNSKKDENLEISDSGWGDYAPHVTYEDDDAIYTDPTTHQRYTWNKIDNSWVPSSVDVPGRTYTYENDTHVYTEPDGSKLFWDTEKKAWLPKIDDDFLAFYQMSYGFVDNVADEKQEKDKIGKKETKSKLEPPGLKRKTEPQWFEQAKESNTKVYVSNLPLDITEEEFVDFMQKCGLVERDPSSQKMKVKMYYDKEHNCFKGDALCTYIKIESVDLALKLLDGSDFKGNTVKVERAHFQLKGEYNPSLKPKKKKKKELEKIKKMQQKLFDWRPEKFIGERSKHERIVIVKNLFHPSDFDNEVQLILDYQQDLREECAKCGEVRKVVIYDRHPEGVAQITMKEPELADAVVQLINGRWFGKKQITAEIWDGRTKYRIAETDADINKRIEKWDNFLEQKEDKVQSTDNNMKIDAGVSSEPQNDNTKMDTCLDKKDTTIT